MNWERDPMLEAAFAEAEGDLLDDQFTAAVMARIQRRQRRVIAGRIAIVVAVIAFELLLSAPLQTTVAALTQALGTALVEMENEWLAIALGPLNSVAGLIGLGLLGLQFLYRRLV